MYSFLTLFGPFFVQTFGCIREENSRSGYFNVTQNKKLTGHTIRTTTTDSLMVYGQFCLREANCFAFNYKTRGRGQFRICELKGRGLKTGKQHSGLTYDKNYDYATLENVSLGSLLASFECFLSLL